MKVCVQKLSSRFHATLNFATVILISEVKDISELGTHAYLPSKYLFAGFHFGIIILREIIGKHVETRCFESP